MKLINQRITISLLLVFSMAIFVLKIMWVSLMPSPWVVDEFVYVQTARAIINQLSFVPVGLSPADYQFYPPGYPLAISMAYLFGDPEIAYKTTLVLNAFLTTLLIPFTYLLALQYLNSKRALMTAVVAGFSPPLISYIFVIMSENLFIPLFMLTILILYHAASRMEMKNWFLVGLLTACLVLVRIQGIAMIAGLLAVILWGVKRKTIGIRNCLSTILGLLIVLGPYSLYRLFQTTTVTGYPENYYVSNLYSILTTMSGFLTFLRLTVNELGYLYICGLGVITLLGCLFIFEIIKDTQWPSPSKQIIVYFCVSSLMTVLMTVLHMYGSYLGQTHMPREWYEVFGRYLDPIMIPLMVFGLIYLFSHHSFSWPFKSVFIALSVVIIATFPCNIYHPASTWAIIYLQYFKGIIPHQLILALLFMFLAIVLLRPYQDWFKTVNILVIFLTINIFAANCQIINGRTETIGLWLKQQFPPVEKVYVDTSTPYHERLWRSVAFWNPSLDVDYLNFSPEPSPGNAIMLTSGKTLLITDKTLKNQIPSEDIFLGHRVYQIAD